MPIIDPQTFTFIGIVVALSITPGATTMLITRNVIAHGYKAGFIVVFGGCIGVFFHATLSALGLSLILVQSARLFETIKLLGALYLIFLGGQSIRRGLRQKPNGPSSLNRRALALENKTGWKVFLEGFVTIILSPETSVFYLAILPQFISFGESILLKSFMLASIHAIVRLVWYSTLTVFLARITAMLKRPRMQQWLEITSGATLVFLGLKIAAARR
jgi:threonine/homoserine/homoserine lactone efflux protein